MKNNFYKNTLKTEKRQLYEAIYDAILRRQQSLDVRDDIDRKEVKLIIEAIQYDHPELFYFKSFELVEKRFIITKKHLGLEYYYIGKNDIDKLTTDLRCRISQYIPSVNGKYENVPFEEFVCNMLIDSKNYSKSKFVDLKGLSHTALGTFVETQRSLDGYVLSVKYVMDQVGIPCIVVRGGIKRRQDGQEKKYLWNIIWIDGKAYNIDLWELFRKNAGNKKLNQICKSDDDIKGIYCKDEEYPRCFSYRESKPVLRESIKVEKKVDITNVKLPKINISIGNESPIEGPKKPIIKEKYVGDTIIITSDDELRNLIERRACVYPFDIAVQIDYDSDLKKIAAKISDYILSYFVKHGKLISITYKCYEANNVIHIFSEYVK